MKKESEWKRKLDAMTPEQRAAFKAADREYQRKWREAKKNGTTGKVSEPKRASDATDSDGWEWFPEERPIHQFPPKSRVLFVNAVSGERQIWEIRQHWTQNAGTEIIIRNASRRTFVAHTKDGDQEVAFTSQGSRVIPISSNTPVAAIQRGV